VNFENQFAPGPRPASARGPGRHLPPNPLDPVLGYAPTRSLASSRGETATVGLFAFDTVDLGRGGSVRRRAGGALRHRLPQRRRGRRDDRELEGADTLVSGKAASCSAQPKAAISTCRTARSVTPPGTANFTLSAQANNQNNPSVKPQECANFEVGSNGTSSAPVLSVTGAVFRTATENVYLTVDATAIPPILPTRTTGSS
jgi:catecholate siderophore receptor